MIECANCKNKYDVNEQSCPQCGEPAPGSIPAHCPYCGTGTQPGEKFCSGCGQAIQPVAAPRCETCGSPLRIGAGFCAQCGEPVIGAHAPTQPVQAPQPMPLRIAEETSDDVSYRYKAEEELDEKDFFGDPLSEQRSKEESAQDDVLAQTSATEEAVHATEEMDSNAEELEWPADTPNLEAHKKQEAQTEGGVSEETILPEPKSSLDRSVPLFENTEEFEDVKKAVKRPKKRKSGVWILLLILLAIIAGLALVWLKLLPGALGQKRAVDPNPSVVAPREEKEETPELPGEPDANDGEETVEKTDYSFVAETIVPIEWDKVTAFDETTGLARVTRDEKMGIVEADGNILVPPIYDNIGEFHDNMAVIQIDTKFGYVDSSGQEVVAPIYEDAKDFGEGFGAVAQDGKYGFVSNDNSKDIKFNYTTASSYVNGFAGVSLGDQYFFVNTEGEQMSPMYEEVGDFQGALAPVKSNGLWGYVDDQFSEIIPFKYTSALSFHDGVAIVQEGNKKHMINTQGDTVSPIVDDMWPLSDGVATVQVGSHYGFVNGKSKDDFLITPQYIDVYAHSEGLFPVSSNKGIWYYVDSTGDNVIKEVFDEAYSFKNGVARVKKDLKYTIINNIGEQVVINWWDGIGVYQFDLLPVEENGKWGFVRLV